MGIFFQMAISLLVYVATSSENFIYREATSSQYALLLSNFFYSYFFGKVSSLEQLLFFKATELLFLRAMVLPSSYFLRICSYFGLSVFRTATFFRVSHRCCEHGGMLCPPPVLGEWLLKIWWGGSSQNMGERGGSFKCCRKIPVKEFAW